MHLPSRLGSKLENFEPMFLIRAWRLCHGLTSNLAGIFPKWIGRNSALELSGNVYFALRRAARSLFIRFLISSSLTSKA